MTELITDNDWNELVELRHYFHAHPELSNQEVHTTEKVKELLTQWGIEIVPTKLNTGLLAKIAGKQPGASIALRADLDALPVTEDTDLAFKSTNPGVMHACGHDLHITSLLGAAKFFSGHRDLINGNIYLLFQPAEEAGGGANQVVAKHVLSGIQAVLGFHNNPNLPTGMVALQSGPMMAGCSKFHITIKGQGSHGAKPENSHDPIVTLGALIENLQTITSRNVNPQDAVVVSITHVGGGEAWNVIPDTAFLEGTVRVFKLANDDLVQKRMTEIVKGFTAAFNQDFDIDWSERALPIDNNPELTNAVINNLAEKVEKPVLSMAGEDFATYQETIPGVFAFIGSNGQPNAADWHEPQFVGLDATIKTGVEYFVDGALGILKDLNEK